MIRFAVYFQKTSEFTEINRKNRKFNQKYEKTHYLLDIYSINYRFTRRSNWDLKVLKY